MEETGRGPGGPLCVCWGLRGSQACGPSSLSPASRCVCGPQGRGAAQGDVGRVSRQLPQTPGSRSRPGHLVPHPSHPVHLGTLSSQPTRPLQPPQPPWPPCLASLSTPSTLSNRPPQPTQPPQAPCPSSLSICLSTLSIHPATPSTPAGLVVHGPLCLSLAPGVSAGGPLAFLSLPLQRGCPGRDTGLSPAEPDANSAPLAFPRPASMPTSPSKVSMFS